MLKKLEKFCVNFLLLWVVISTMPGVESPNGSVGYLLTGSLFGLLILSLPGVLKFFKFPQNGWAKLFVGTALTYILLSLISRFTPDVLTIKEGFVGGFDFIWFTTPRILSLPSTWSVIGFVSLISNICSIILHFLNKGRL